MDVEILGDERDSFEPFTQHDDEPPLIQCRDVHDGLLHDSSAVHAADIEAPCQRQNGLNPAAPEFVPSCSLHTQSNVAEYCHANDLGTLEIALMAAGAMSQDTGKGDVANTFGCTNAYYEDGISTADSCGGLFHTDDVSGYFNSSHLAARQKSQLTGSLADMLQSVRRQELNAARCIQKVWRSFISRPRSRPAVPHPKREAGVPRRSFRDVAMTGESTQENLWSNYSRTIGTTAQCGKPSRRGKSLVSESRVVLAKPIVSMDDPWAAAIAEKKSANLPLTQETMLSQTHEGRVADYFKRKGHGFIKHRRIFDLIGKDVFYLGSDFPSARRENDRITFRIVMDRDGKPRAYPPPIVDKSRSANFDSKSSPWGLYTGRCSTQLGTALRSRSTGDRLNYKGGLASGAGGDLKALLNDELNGTITELPVDAGNGFIKNGRVREICGSDVYFSRDQFIDCKVGTAVNFRMELDESGKPRVKDDATSSRIHLSCSSVTKPAKSVVGDASDECDEKNLLTLEECLNSVHEGVIADYDPCKARGYVRNRRVHRLFGKDVLFHKGQFERCNVGEVVHFGIELDLDGRPRVRDPSEVRRDLQTDGADGTDEPLSYDSLLSLRHEGVIYQFAKDRGYGFVRNCAIQRLCGRDVFITAHHFIGREVGDAVTFNVELTNDGLPRARNVRGIGEEPEPLTIEELLTREHVGSIVDWDETQGVGFIKNRQIHKLCGKDVLFRSGEFPGKNVGDTVCFSVALDEKGRPRTREIEGDKIVHRTSMVANYADSVSGNAGVTKKPGRPRSHSASARSHSIGHKACAASESIDQDSRKRALKLLASDSTVALIIGRKASAISELSRSTGVYFTFTTRDDYYRGTNFRVMTAFSPTDGSLREAFQQIVDMIVAEEEKKLRSKSELEKAMRIEMRVLVPVIAVPTLREDGAGLQQLSDACGISATLDSEIVGDGPGREQTLRLIGGKEQLRASFAWLIRRIGQVAGNPSFSQWAIRTNTPADPHADKSVTDSQASSAPGEFNVVLGSDFGPLGLCFRSDDPSVVESTQPEVRAFLEQRQRVCVGDRLVKVNGRLIQGRDSQDTSQELARRPVLLTFVRNSSLAVAKADSAIPTKCEDPASTAADNPAAWTDSTWWNARGAKSWIWNDWNDWYSGDRWNDWYNKEWRQSSWDWRGSYAGYVASNTWEQRRDEDPDHGSADAEVRRSTGYTA